MRAWLGLLLALLADCAGPGDRVGGALDAEVAAWNVVDVGDFDGDGMADAFWSDAAGGHLALQLIRGQAIASASPVITGPPGEGWNAVAAGDFDGDGRFDVLWWNGRRGRMVVWLMEGTEVLAAGPEISGPPGEGWAAITPADVDGDGLGDVVFYNETTRRLCIYLMAGIHLLAAGPEIPGPPGEGWMVVTTGDFDHDGLQDILWFNRRTHEVAVWLMDGTRVREPGPPIPGPPGDGWQAIYDADFDRDGMADVLWTNASTGRAMVWLMRGVHPIEASEEISAPPGAGWIAAAAGDADGDGMADIFWCQPGSPARISIMEMAGDGVAAPGAVLPGPP